MNAATLPTCNACGRLWNDHDPDTRVKVIRSLIPYVMLCPSRLEQWSFAQRISQKLDIPFEIVWEEIWDGRQDSDRATSRDR
jgi:hypothetical protein